jgi:hypothetical protein
MGRVISNKSLVETIISMEETVNSLVDSLSDYKGAEAQMVSASIKQFQRVIGMYKATDEKLKARQNNIA